ncbi:MarR family transcriptional regulator [Corynebacterium hindlerae]|uniref:MarR family winged helix-turn-helix transcriptional regulator n=1 Tax=Corynebacterium hindlerae TaxID=699041 RepID=UPI001AD75B25|nr:MarR family transcriptional regulator [Corynebacterium hindlerae]QTH58596.1 MarR family transcriptional regulator [Corynebacterium hindlerae]
MAANMELKSSLVNLQCELVAERALVNPEGITWLQYDILFQLEKEREIVPSLLSAVLGISRAKLSKALKELKALGYVVQSPNPSDGRELLTSVTAKGKRILRNISEKHETLHQTALEVLGEEEQHVFARLAKQLSAALREKRLEQ